ncbi:MAG: hypothetical protein OXC46_00835 [Thaumarchaeota archaeon]|nr:hypothetical protein [Nitrososphaerota archaeon]
MPKPGYKSLSIKDADMDMFQAFFSAHEQTLRETGVTSVTGLMLVCMYKGFRVVKDETPESTVSTEAKK